MKTLSSGKKHEKGQGLVEYALILVLVAIVVIGTLTILGPSIGNVFSSINNSITTAGSGGGGGQLVQEKKPGQVPCPQHWQESCEGGGGVASCTEYVYTCSPK